MKRKGQEEVGDLFVTEKELLIKLLPSRKSGSMSIDWFEGGRVKDHHGAAKDILSLVERIRRRTSVVRGLTLMTDRGLRFDLGRSGLPRAVERAGFRVLN